jgi:hypothetical protein
LRKPLTLNDRANAVSIKQANITPTHWPLCLPKEVSAERWREFVCSTSVIRNAVIWVIAIWQIAIQGIATGDGATCGGAVWVIAFWPGEVWFAG